MKERKGRIRPKKLGHKFAKVGAPFEVAPSLPASNSLPFEEAFAFATVATAIYFKFEFDINDDVTFIIAIVVNPYVCTYVFEV